MTDAEIYTEAEQIAHPNDAHYIVDLIARGIRRGIEIAQAGAQEALIDAHVQGHGKGQEEALARLALARLARLEARLDESEKKLEAMEEDHARAKAIILANERRIERERGG